MAIIESIGLHAKKITGVSFYVPFKQSGKYAERKAPEKRPHSPLIFSHKNLSMARAGFIPFYNG